MEIITSRHSQLSGLRKIDITCSPQDVVTCLRPTTNGDRRLLQLQPQPSPNRLFTPTSTSRCNVLPPSPWFIVLVHSQLINQAARLRPAIFQLLSASFVTAPVGLPLPRTVVSLLGPDKTSTHRVYDRRPSTLRSNKPTTWISLTQRRHQ